MNRTFVYLIVLLISACAPGNGNGLDANGRPIGETPEPGDEPTLANVQARVFSAICIQCHIGAAAPQGLRLDASNSYNDLVGVPSRQVGGLLRVDPFNPDDSYIVQKIEGTAGVGGQMPLGLPPLPAEDRLLIRQWILDGALPTPAASIGAGKVISTNMQFSRSDTGEVMTVVRVAFSSNLNPASVHSGSVILNRSADAMFGNEDDVAIGNFEVSVSPFNASAVIVKIPDYYAESGWYRLELGSSISARILDQSGQEVEPHQMEFH